MKKDNGLKAALIDLMGESPEADPAPTERGPQVSHKQATSGTQIGHSVAQDTPKRPKGKRNNTNLEGRHIRLAPADWKALDGIAEAEGGTISALVRRAVREMISRRNAQG